MTWPLFLSTALPNILAEANVDQARIAAVVRDVEQRATDYAGGGKSERRLLRAPFLDDVASFDPEEAPIGSRADVAVVVRNSELERFHSMGSVGDDEIATITYLATGALNQWLRENADRSEHKPLHGVFAGVSEFPRACAALTAMALAAEVGGRKAIGRDRNQVPAPLARDPHVDRVSQGEEDTFQLVATVRCGLDPIDSDLERALSRVAGGDADLLFTSSLSRYSRNSVHLAQALEFVLSNGGSVLTSNFLVRPREVFSRRAPLIGSNSAELLSNLSTDRLSGLHARHVRDLLRQHGMQV